VFDIGIRREDKNRWERRAPLTPLHVRELVRDHGRRVAVEPSPVRIYRDDEYRDAGAAVTENLSACRVILGVKEIPRERLLPGRPHLFFAHVIKGQPNNMAMLRRLLELRCTLIDYETIVDPDGQRLIFFGRHAGYAGMIDALWALGQRLLGEGVETAFAGVRPAHAYPSLAAAGAFLAGEVAGRIRDAGVRPELHPLVFGFTGGGNVSQGAQRILDHLPVV
jgi:alpha-aminoadipic semialdehyde synthase